MVYGLYVIPFAVDFGIFRAAVNTGFTLNKLGGAALAPLIGKAAARFGHDLELNWPTCLLLDDGCSVADGAAADQVSNAQLHKVALAQFAVDSQVEQDSVSQSLVVVEVKPDRPDIARSERAFWAHILPRIPGAPFVHGGVKIGMAHCASPVAGMAILEMGPTDTHR